MNWFNIGFDLEFHCSLVCCSQGLISNSENISTLE